MGSAVNLCCRLCLDQNDKLFSIFEEDLKDKINTYLPIKITEEDLITNICCSCSDTLKAFDNLYSTAVHSNEKIQKLLEKNRREEEEQAELADTLMLNEGNKLRINFEATQDDGSDKSLSIETDLAKDIDRILAMTQLDDIAGGPSQIYNCEFCQPHPPIATLSELNEHLKSAHIDLVFHCETCDNFIDRNCLIEHMMQHLREMRDDGQNVEIVEQEVESNKDEEVAQENAESNKAKDMDSDDTSPKERRNLLKEASGSNVKYLKKCHYCPKLFSNRSGRLYHQEQAHFNRKRFQCDQCQRSFGLKQTLMNHIRNKHSNNVRSFKCDLCDKTYKTKSALYNHRVYHSKEDPKYHCNYCTKKFHFNFLLQQHETIHLGLAKSYECDVCKKIFNTKNKLTKHRGIHANNQHVCTKEGCNFKGNLKRYLIAHIKRMHNS
ncbi:unnamed protein product [Chironomus riparius]|uniref:Uncharacterized protein n=1 Tax=Chironomus riparius TaxID=315576 RepID=A0A9N9S0G2_9DIPT|nr:unnamed protein product [Chironomus riparius]